MRGVTGTEVKVGSQIPREGKEDWLYSLMNSATSSPKHNSFSKWECKTRFECLRPSNGGVARAEAGVEERPCVQGPASC